MLFTSFISLYTARLVLENLGIEDFGIYNVVGGVVTFMGFLNATLSSATQRFLTYNIGLNDSQKFRQTYSLLINVYMVFCAISLIFLEIAGPIYISRFMTIPEERVTAALWAFQFSLLSFLVSTVTVPHRSSIIAYEKMGMYAYIGIAEAILGFAAVVVLPYVNYDSLIIFGFFMCLYHICIALMIVLYCRFKLPDCRYQKYWNNAYFKELLSYSGWNLFGSISGVLMLQGQAVVLNSFFGPIVNAAKAVADRVNSMVSHFSNNFCMATTPQIIKSYASGNIEYMRSLVINTSRYSFIMLLIIAAPLCVIMDSFLNLWLGEKQVTPDMVIFCRWTIISLMINILEQPITMAVRATGDLKKYQIYVGVITLAFLPLCVIVFLFKVPAYFSMILLSLVLLVAIVVRVMLLSPIIEITPIYYFKEVVVPIFRVCLYTVLVIVIIEFADVYVELNWIVKFVIVLSLVFIICLFMGITCNERLLLLSMFKNKINSVLNLYKTKNDGIY